MTNQTPAPTTLPRASIEWYPRPCWTITNDGKLWNDGEGIPHFDSKREAAAAFYQTELDPEALRAEVQPERCWVVRCIGCGVHLSCGVWDPDHFSDADSAARAAGEHWHQIIGGDFRCQRCGPGVDG